MELFDDGLGPTAALQAILRIQRRMNSILICAVFEAEEGLYGFTGPRILSLR